ncbi:hypothetical protein [Streptodolium elevatio]
MSNSSFVPLVQAWINDVTSGQPSGEGPAFDALRDEVGRQAPPSRRPDLYQDDQTLPSAKVLLKVVGLADVSRLIASGANVAVDDLAHDLTAMCAAPTPVRETWLLLDADLPAGTSVPIGPYTLRTATRTDLSALHPLPSLLPLLPNVRLHPDVLQRSAFLTIPRPTAPLTSGGLQLTLDTRPALRHIEVLTTLMMWRHEPLHLDAVFHIEAGRHVGASVPFEDFPLDAIFDNEGEVVAEVHQRGRYKVKQTELTAFAAFCARTWNIVDTVASATPPTPDPFRKASRRFGAAARHLIQASSRTYGDDYIDDHELDELLLQYVIGLEAILKGSKERARQPTVVIKQNAATLRLDDHARAAAYNTMSQSYNLRSAYAHGDEVKNLNEAAVAEARGLLIDTLLRWLVTSEALGADAADELQRTLINDDARAAVVTRPLRTFFASTPPAVRPADA